MITPLLLSFGKNQKPIEGFTEDSDTKWTKAIVSLSDKVLSNPRKIGLSFSAICILLCIGLWKIEAAFDIERTMGIQVPYVKEVVDVGRSELGSLYSYELPTEEENPWSIGELTIGKEPKHKLYNMEYGGRLSFFLSGIDFSFSALHTWNKTPVFHNAIGEYHRMTMLGADMSVPINKFVVRGEFAEYLNEAQQTIGAEKIARASSTNALIGLDWYAGNDWSLSAQYAHKYVAYGEHNNSGLATFRISKDLFNNTLNLQSFAYLDVENGGVYNRLSTDYALNDQLHTLIGYDFFHADKGTFSVYDKNSEVWLKLKYSF